MRKSRCRYEMHIKIKCFFLKQIQEGEFFYNRGGLVESQLKSIRTILNPNCIDQLLIF